MSDAHVVGRIVDRGAHVVDVPLHGRPGDARLTAVVERLAEPLQIEGMRAHTPFAEALEQRWGQIGHDGIHARLVLQEEGEEGAQGAAGLVIVDRLAPLLLPVGDENRRDSRVRRCLPGAERLDLGNVSIEDGLRCV
ncbi:hypothetical protein JI59_16495 [Novosphingobium pentaromativorans US6-1]|nr:hypothetical protein JI59_16495 [Novosphingobium pentaromativorans US6-1]